MDSPSTLVRTFAFGPCPTVNSGDAGEGGGDRGAANRARSGNAGKRWSMRCFKFEGYVSESEVRLSTGAVASRESLSDARGGVTKSVGRGKCEFVSLRSTSEFFRECSIAGL